MYASTFFEQKLLDTFRGLAFVAPSKLYVGLFINSPTESGIAGTEISYPNYARMEITFGVPAPESGGIGVFNTNELVFAQTVASVGIASYIGIFDSLTGGNMYLYGEPAVPLDIKADEAPVLLINDVLFFSTGNLSITLKTKAFNVMRGQTIQGFSPKVALFNGSPEQAGSELIGANYVRQPVLFNAPATAVGGSSTITNNGQVTFPRATTNWGNYNYKVITEGDTSEVLAFAARSVRQAEIGRQVFFASGDIRATVN